MKILMKPKRTIVYRQGKKVPAYLLCISVIGCNEEGSRECGYCERKHSDAETQCAIIWRRLKEDGYLVNRINGTRSWTGEKTISINHVFNWDRENLDKLQGLLDEEMARMRDFLKPFEECAPTIAMKLWLDLPDEEIEITI